MAHRRIRGKMHRRKKTGKKILLVTGAAAGGLAAVYLGVALFFTFHFLPNTKIGGKDFSIRTADAVSEYQKEKIQGYELTVKGRDGQTDVLKADDISLVYRENGGSGKLLKKQPALLWIKAFFEEQDLQLSADISYDKNALEKKIVGLKVMTAEQVQPEPASPKFDGEKFVPGEGKEGTAVRTGVLPQKIEEAVRALEPELDLEEAGCYEEAEYKLDSPEVQTACDEMNGYLKASITYEMDEPVVVDKTLISKWLTVDEEMHVVFQEEAVKEWLSEFGKKYDTAGKKRTFTTPDGKSAEVSGGAYGWEVDEKAELTALTESIRKGETVTKAPAYCEGKTAVSHGAQDWGNTYAEVDLTRQKMWYVRDGEVAMEADVVTGQPTPEKETPAGVYSILEKLRNKVLKGEIQADGEREYETPVDYWMRVTYTGIGFHDADWQSAFGGELYKTEKGSHGCINMSVPEAAKLYEMIQVGDPVIVHY